MGGGFRRSARSSSGFFRTGSCCGSRPGSATRFPVSSVPASSSSGYASRGQGLCPQTRLRRGFPGGRVIRLGKDVPAGKSDRSGIRSVFAGRQRNTVASGYVPVKKRQYFCGNDEMDFNRTGGTDAVVYPIEWADYEKRTDSRGEARDRRQRNRSAVLRRILPF